MTAAGKVRFERDLDVRHRVDVFVAGGGPAGVSAAVVAARQGKSVFLAEGSGCLGGMGTAGGLPLFCYMTDGVNFLGGAIGREVTMRLWEAGGASPLMRRDLMQCDFIYKGEVLKRVYDDLLSASGAQFSLLTQMIAVEARGGRIERVVCWGKSGLFAVEATVYVDATGDGDLCAWAGAEFEKGDAHGAMQPPTLCSMWADIDWEKANAAGCGLWQQQGKLGPALADGVFTVPDRHLPGMIPTGAHTGGGNLGHTFGVDGTDERSLTQGLIWGRKVLTEYERFYKTYLQGFEQMELVGTAALLGVRETRRIMGDYVLNLEDFKKRAVFADEIGRFSYPVDLHATKADPQAYAKMDEDFARLRYKPGESYGIPYRCLTPRRLVNVLVAGRCVSTDRQVQGSLRVMSGCFTTGQAAGTAAALAVEQALDVHEVPVPELQRRLKDQGAFLPNN